MDKILGKKGMCSLVFAQGVLGIYHDLIKNLFWYEVRLELTQRAKYRVFSSKVVEHGDYMVITWPTFLFWVGWSCNHPLSVDSMLNTSNFAHGVIRNFINSTTCVHGAQKEGHLS